MESHKYANKQISKKWKRQSNKQCFHIVLISPPLFLLFTLEQLGDSPPLFNNSSQQLNNSLITFWQRDSWKLLFCKHVWIWHASRRHGWVLSFGGNVRSPEDGLFGVDSLVFGR